MSDKQQEPTAASPEGTKVKASPEDRTPELRELAEHDPAPSAAWWRAAFIGAGALVLTIGTLALVSMTAHALALFFIAIVIAEAVTPLVSMLERWLSRALAVGLFYLGMLIVFSGFMWFLVPRMVAQAQEMGSQGPILLERIEEIFDTWDVEEDQVFGAVEGNLDRFTDLLVTVPMALMTSVTQIVLVVFMSAYWLISKPGLHEFVQTLVPKKRQKEVDDTLEAISHTVGGYVRGEVLSGFIIGAITYTGLSIIGLQFALVLAILAGLGELVPVAGPIVAAIPGVLVALLESPTQALIVAGFYLLLQQIESNIIIPNLMDNQANIPPLLVIIALFAGAGVGGILGAIVAIPLAGALRVLVVYMVAPAIRQWTGAEAHATPLPQSYRRAPASSRSRFVWRKRR